MSPPPTTSLGKFLRDKLYKLTGAMRVKELAAGPVNEALPDPTPLLDPTHQIDVKARPPALPPTEQRLRELLRLPKQPSPCNLTSGAPASLTSPKRTVYLFRESRGSMQQGVSPASSGSVLLEFDKKSPKWDDRLLGWTGSADPVQGLAKSGMNFKRVGDAIMFAERQGWNWRVYDDRLLREVEEEVAVTRGGAEARQVKYPKAKSYAENFTYSPDKLRILRTK